MEYIDLNNPIFLENPDEKFAETYHVPKGFWDDMCRRFKHWGYSQDDLIEWFNFKTGKHISRKSIWRWTKRQEIYDDAQRAVKAGSTKVTVRYFTRNEEIVIEYKKDEKDQHIHENN